jgi:predicted aspartyl protease
MIRFRYVQDKTPPAPFVHVTVRNPLTGAALVDTPALVDTGADRSVLPVSVAEALSLVRHTEVTIEGVGGERMTLATFIVDFAIRQHAFQRVAPVALEGESHIILGRDVLNHHRIVLDGPNLALEVG